MLTMTHTGGMVSTWALQTVSQHHAKLAMQKVMTSVSILAKRGTKPIV
jgi:hypothetical protein